MLFPQPSVQLELSIETFLETVEVAEDNMTK